MLLCSNFKGVWKLFLQLFIISIILLSGEICVIVIDVFKEALAVPRALALFASACSDSCNQQTSVGSLCREGPEERVVVVVTVVVGEEGAGVGDGWEGEGLLF